MSAAQKPNTGAPLVRVDTGSGSIFMNQEEEEGPSCEGGAGAIIMRLLPTEVTCPCRGPGAIVVQTILWRGEEGGRGSEHHGLHVTQTARALLYRCIPPRQRSQGPPIQIYPPRRRQHDPLHQWGCSLVDPVQVP